MCVYVLVGARTRCWCVARHASRGFVRRGERVRGVFGAPERAEATRPRARVQMHKTEWENRLLLLERVYGPAAAMHLKQQHEILRRVSRLPGLPSSHIALDTLLARDTSMGFEDFLGGTRARARVARERSGAALFC